MKNRTKVTIAFLLIAVLTSLTACSAKETPEIKISPPSQSAGANDDSVGDNSMSNDNAEINAPSNIGSNGSAEDTDSNNITNNSNPAVTPKGNKSGDDAKGTGDSFTVQDYMTMNDSIENFTAFVNRRSDFTSDEKKEIIDARTRQLEISAELMQAYKKILTADEFAAYQKQPEVQALEPGAAPVDDVYTSAINKINAAKKSDKSISGLNKELEQVKGGLLGGFVDKVGKEKSKLLGF